MKFENCYNCGRISGYFSCILLLFVLSCKLYKVSADESAVCGLKILSGFTGDNPLYLI